MNEKMMDELDGQDLAEDLDRKIREAYATVEDNDTKRIAFLKRLGELLNAFADEFEK